MAEGEFSPVESFGIDGGELDGLSPQECFVLGVEWAMIAGLADHSNEQFERAVHSDNRERLEKLLAKRGRRFQLNHMHDDASESWLWLSVAPTEE